MPAGIVLVLLALPVLPGRLDAVTATVKDYSAVEFRVLGSGGVQYIETAGYEIAGQKPELESVARPDQLLESFTTVSGAIAKPSEALATDGDDIVHDGPRSKMRKWFFVILLIGGLVRYLSSDSYRRFVSETLDPLNW
jgi:hypothetical protein